MVLLQSYVQIITVNPVHSTVLLQSHSHRAYQTSELRTYNSLITMFVHVSCCVTHRDVEHLLVAVTTLLHVEGGAWHGGRGLLEICFERKNSSFFLSYEVILGHVTLHTITLCARPGGYKPRITANT